MTISQVIESAKHLNPSERALVAHCMIYSLETKQDDGVDEAWVKLAERRYAELMSGKVKSVSWSDIKKEIKGQEINNDIS